MQYYIIVSIIAYAIGSIMSSVIISRKFAGFDIRTKGSKNAGTTNALRTMGKKASFIVLICDILKGVIAILIAMLVAKIANIEDATSLKYLAGFFVILGHTFPIFFEFRGGKGVATSLGVLLMLDAKIGLICLTLAIALMAITKMVSVGSLVAAILYPILVIFIHGKENIFSIVISILIALLIIFNHRENIKRLKEGKEDKIHFFQNRREN